MIESRSRASFQHKTAHPLFILGEGGGKNFERDFAIEAGVFGQINLAHTARAQFGQDAVVREVGYGGPRFHR